jgi:hypothetical protein
MQLLLHQKQAVQRILNHYVYPTIILAKRGNIDLQINKQYVGQHYVANGLPPFGATLAHSI